MSLVLNGISKDEFVQTELLPWAEKRLTRVLTKVPPTNSSEAAYHWQFLASIRAEVGLLYYQQERPHVEILEHFRPACDALARKYELRPTLSGGLMPWHLIKDMSFAVAFGDGAVRDRFAGLPSTLYATEDPEDVTSRDYLDALRSVLRGEPRDMTPILEACSRRTASRFETLHIRPLVRCLSAVLAGDGPGLDSSLQECLRRHLKDVKGELRTDVEGFMVIDALVHVRLALERGIPITVESPYLPVSLVERAWKTTPSS